MRPIIYKEWNFETYPPRLLEMGEAIFHQWGVDYKEFENGPGNYSTAIIELPTGEIKNVSVELIKFTDHF